LYSKLDSAKIIGTAERLARRVDQQFPQSGLSKVAAEIVAVSHGCERDAMRLGRAHKPIRLLVAALFAAGVGSALLVARDLKIGHVEGGDLTLVQAIDSAMNIAILFGLGVISLLRWESNWKKRRALAALHPLRSLAHIIDMHQLTKDPNRVRRPLARGEGDQRSAMAPDRLVAYLDDCSDMLALIGKMAALFAQSHQESSVVQTVNDIEVLTTNLSRKIWQKIAIVEQRFATVPSASLEAPAGL
jgi:hypothetical protein